MEKEGDETPKFTAEELERLYGSDFPEEQRCGLYGPVEEAFDPWNWG